MSQTLHCLAVFPASFIYALPSLMTYITRPKVSLIIILSASAVLEVVKCFSYLSYIQAESVMCFK